MLHYNPLDLYIYNPSIVKFHISTQEGCSMEFWMRAKLRPTILGLKDFFQKILTRAAK